MFSGTSPTSQVMLSEQEGCVAPEPPGLTHGPVVGAVTATHARVFVRTSAPAQVRIRYGATSDLPNGAESAAQFTRADSDFTTQVELQGLNASTSYYLQVLVNGVAQLCPPYPHFKTFPVAGSNVPFRFVLLTDFKTARKNSKRYVETFKSAAAEQPDFVIIGGDFDHSNAMTLAAKRDMFKALYTSAHNYQDFINLILRQFPVAHMWDDHDFGGNNSDKTNPSKKIAREVLAEYFPVYDLPAVGDADYQQFSYGPADFFLLDERSQRDPEEAPDGPYKSMLDGDRLGAVGQLQWLKNGLLNSKAKWKFLITPVVFNPSLDKPDSWNGYQYERQQLVSFIKQNHITGVILISGDLHAGALDDGTNADFPEMVVPSANAGSCFTATRWGMWSVGHYGDKGSHCNGYGVISVGTDSNQVKLEVKDTQGNTRLSLAVWANSTH